MGTVRSHLSAETMISLILCFISSVSTATLPTLPATNLCEQYEMEIQPNVLQNARGEFKCLEQDIENRCEDVLSLEQSYPQHRARLNNQTIKISVCLKPGSSCLGCQESPPLQEAVCTQRFRKVELSVLKDNFEEFEMDTFSLEDGCQCNLTRSDN